MTNEELWQITLRKLQLSISQAELKTWFRQTAIVFRGEGMVTILIPNSFSREWLENKYHKLILKILSECDPEIKRIEYFISPAPQIETEKEKRFTKVDTVQTRGWEIDSDKIIEFIKSHQKLLFAVLLALIMGLWFYWSQIRPASILSECNYKAKEESFGWPDRYELIYKQCLREKGLK